MFIKVSVLLVLFWACIYDAVADGGVDQGPTGLPSKPKCSSRYCGRKWSRCMRSRILRLVNDKFRYNRQELYDLVKSTYLSRCKSGKSSRPVIASVYTFRAPQCRLLGCAEAAIRMRKWCDEKSRGGKWVRYCKGQASVISRSCLSCVCGGSLGSCYLQGLIDG